MSSTTSVAALFIAPHVENEEFEHVVELACGHILCKKDDDKATGARCGLLGSNSLFSSLFSNLSIYEATRCPICESNLLANRNVGSEHEFGGVPKKHTTVAKSGELWGPER